MLPGIVPAVGGGGIRATWLGAATTADTGPTASFGPFTIPTGGGLVVALITCHGADSRTMTQVTFGGLVGTLHATHGASGTRKAAIASHVVPAGNWSIVSTLSGNNGTSPRNFCGCWLLSGYLSATPVFAQYAYNGNTNLSIGITHDIPGRAALFYQANEISAVDPTWTAAQLDGSVTAGSGARSHWASRISPAPGTGVTETATYASGATHLLMNAAIWA